MNRARSALVLAIFGALVVVSTSYNSEEAQKNFEDALDKISSSVENIRQSDRSKENRALANTRKCFFPHGPHPHQEDCSKWYLCLFWRATEMTCRRGQLFDARLFTCRTSFLVNCGTRRNPYDDKETTVSTTARTTTTKPTTIKLTTQNLITDEVTDLDDKTTKNDDNSDITTSSESSKETTSDSGSSEEKSTTDSNKSKGTDSGEDSSSTSESKEKTSATDSDDNSPITPDSREIDLTTKSDDKSPATSDSKEEILTTESNADNTATVSISETSSSTEVELRPETKTDSIIASTTDDITRTSEDIHRTTPEEPNCDEEANKDASDWFTCPAKMGQFNHPLCENLFIFCEGNKPFVKKCATGLKFSLEFLVCVWDENDYFI